MGNVGDGYDAMKQQISSLEPPLPAQSSISSWLRWMSPLIILYILILIWAGRKYREHLVLIFSNKLATTLHRRFFNITKGDIGIGPRSFQKGDAVALFKGEWCHW